MSTTNQTIGISWFMRRRGISDDVPGAPQITGPKTMPGLTVHS